VKIPLGILSSLLLVLVTYADSYFKEKNADIQSCLNSWRIAQLPLPNDIIDTFSVALSEIMPRSLFVCAKNECGEAGNCAWNIIQSSHDGCSEIGLVEGSLDIDTIKHNGYRDIETSWHISASERIITRYQFQLKKYRSICSYYCFRDSRGIETMILIEKDVNNSGSIATIIKPDSSCIEISNAPIRMGTYKDLFVFVPNDCSQSNKNEGNSYIFIQSKKGYFNAGCLPGIPHVLESRKNGYFELETLGNPKGGKRVYFYNGKSYIISNSNK
jgi:hypothetical protein